MCKKVLGPIISLWLVLAPQVAAAQILHVVSSATGSPSSGGSAYTFVQQNAGGGSTCMATSGTSVPCALPANITAGHKLFVMWGAYPAGTDLVSATGCATAWTLGVTSGINRRTSIWYCSSASGGGNSITITAPNACSGSGCLASLSEWSGGTATADQNNTSSGTASAPAAGSITTTGANELILAVLRDADVGTLVSGPSSSFSALNTPSSSDNVEFAYRLTTSTGTYSTGWTLAASAAYDVAIASFK